MLDKVSLEARIALIQKAVEESAANHNALLGRKAEAEFMLQDFLKREADKAEEEKAAADKIEADKAAAEAPVCAAVED